MVIFVLGPLSHGRRKLANLTHFLQFVKIPDSLGTAEISTLQTPTRQGTELSQCFSSDLGEHRVRSPTSPWQQKQNLT